MAEKHGPVHVLNAGTSGGVAGLLNHSGTLRPIDGAAGTLLASRGTAPAQVGFSDDGDMMVVTERNTQRPTNFLVKRNGTPDGKSVTASSGAVPFGFASKRRETLVVSEAPGSAVSSCRFSDGSAAPVVDTPSLANGQGAACWIAVTLDGRFAFSANGATSSVSSCDVARHGQLPLVAGAAGSSGTGVGAIAMAASPSGRNLAVFANHGLQTVDGWATFRQGTCAPPRRTPDDAVSPSTIRLKRASTIAEIRSLEATQVCPIGSAKGLEYEAARRRQRDGGTFFSLSISRMARRRNCICSSTVRQVWQITK